MMVGEVEGRTMGFDVTPSMVLPPPLSKTKTTAMIASPLSTAARVFSRRPILRMRAGSRDCLVGSVMATPLSRETAIPTT